jgi:acetate---CoA ligase (ADP-forming)
MVDLKPMLWPKSIAIVGATAEVKTIRGRLLEYLLQRGYEGQIYLVSGSQDEIRGRRTYRSLKAIARPIDLVLIAVRADATLAIVTECAEIGAKFAICFSSGFAEEGGKGAELQQALANLARQSGLRICGPNTAGFFNVKGAIPATFARNVDVRRAPHKTRRAGPAAVSVVAQSGGLGFALADRCAAEHGVLVNYVTSTGNEVDLEALDFVDFLIEDEDTRVVLLLVEAIKSGTKLATVARRAVALGKPIIVSKFGRTGAGSRAVSSHAARLTGSDQAYDAVFRRHGLIRVDDEEEMVDLAAAFSACPLPKGRRVGILTTSGGAGVWMADACEGAGLEVPLLDGETQSGLSDFIPSYGAIHNPVDMTAQVSVNPVGGSQAASPLVRCVEIMLASPAVDAVVLVANMSDGDVLLRERDGLLEVAKRMDKPLFLYSHAPPSRASIELIQEMGLVCFSSTRRVARSLANMARYAERRKERVDADIGDVHPVSAGDIVLLGHGLCEFEAKALLGRHGIPVTVERLARTAEEAAGYAVDLGGSVALKIQSRDIPHKTEVDGVILNIQGPRDAKSAFLALIDRAKKSAPHAAIEGVLVQQMSAPGRELAVGIVRDPDFGPMMMVGLGGIFIEVLNDVTVEPLPVRVDTALAMLRRLRGWPVLAEIRGTPAADVEAVADLMEKLSLLVEGSGQACQEIDLNPVFVFDKGNGAVVVDALAIGGARPLGSRITGVQP